jgi:hypothetical protein
VRLEGLGKLKKFNGHIGIRPHSFAACNTAPQPLRYRVPLILLEQRHVHVSALEMFPFRTRNQFHAFAQTPVLTAIILQQQHWRDGRISLCGLKKESAK